MNITLLQPSPISPSYPQLHHYYHPSSPFNFITTKTKTINSFVLNYSNTSSITTTSKTEPPDQKLLTLLQQRKTEEAWILYTHSTHIPNPTCLNRLLSQLSYLNTPSSLTRAQSILTRLRNESQLHRLDSNSLGLLAVAAAKAGHTLYASSIVKSMLRSGYLPHVKAWSAVVSCLASDDDVSEPSEALLLFQSVTRRLKKLPDINLAADSVPDTVAFNAALNACAILGDGKMFLQVFDEMPQFGVLPDSFSYNILMKLCCGYNRKDLLVFVLERILQLNIPLCVTTFTSLVAAYVDFNDLETAEKIIQAMREKRRDICRILRESNSQDSVKNYDDVDSVFHKLLPNLMTDNSGNGNENDAPLLPKAYTPNTRIYTTLMKGYMKAGRVTDTVQLLEAMRCQDDSACHPDHVSYTTVVSALVNAGFMERACEVLAEMTRNGVPPNRITYNILLEGYCKQLQMDMARELLKEMAEDAGIQPDVVSYNILMDGCILVDDTAGALSFFNEMRAKGIAPTKISYTTLMKAFAWSGQPKLAQRVFDEMANDTRVRVDLIAWNMLVEGYSKLGLVEEAKKVIQKMKENGFYPNESTYGSFATAIALARKPGEALILWNEVKERWELNKEGGKTDSSVPPLKPDEELLDKLADICVRAAFFKKALEIVACMEENGISPNKTKYTRIYVEMHSRMFTSKHASKARQDRRVERKRAAEAFKFWLGLPNSYYGSEWRLEPLEGYE